MSHHENKQLGTDEAPSALKSVCISLTIPTPIYNKMTREAKRKGLRNIQQLIIYQNQL